MEDFEKFYNLALRFLSYRPRSEKEVRDYLKLKTSHFAKASRDKQNSESGTENNIELLINKVIEKLKEKKFINDEEFAKGWIESRLKFKPRSMKLIKFELRHKGIDDELIDRLIHDSEFIIQNDLESAKKLVEKRIGRLKGLGKQEVYQKLGRFLASKGFDWDTIKKVIDEVLGKGV